MCLLFSAYCSLTSGPRDVNSGTGSRTARFAGELGFAGIATRATTHHIANAAQNSLNFFAMAVGTFHFHRVVFTNSKKLETIVAGKTTEFIDRH